MPPAEPGGVLVFGDLIDDVIVIPDGPIQRDTDTTSSIRSQPGGSAANTAAWLAAAGTQTTFIGRCAAMDVGRHSSLLECVGVQARIISDVDLPTGTIVVLVQGENRSMLTERGANAALSPADIDPTGFAIVHATGYSLVRHEPAFVEFVARAHAVGARVSLNAGSVAAIAEIGLDAFLSASAKVDILIASADEAALLTGVTTPHAAAAALAGHHDIVAVTAGSDGAWVTQRGSAPRHIEPVRITAVDPTGAGDAFTAGLLAGLHRGQTAATAAGQAVRLAAQAVTVVGGRPQASGNVPPLGLEPRLERF